MVADPRTPEQIFNDFVERNRQRELEQVAAKKKRLQGNRKQRRARAAQARKAK